MRVQKVFALVHVIVLVSSLHVNYRGGFTPLRLGYQEDPYYPWWSPSDPTKAAEYPELRSQLYQGDIYIPEEARNAIIIKTYLWKDGIIPYRIADGYFKEPETELIHKSMRIIENATCVKFVTRVDQPDFFEIQGKDKMGCFATIGRRSGKKEPLPMNLQVPDCFRDIGTIQHELLHVVGLLHEQARSDRDKYVTVHWANIDSAYWPQFAKGRDREISPFGLPYDYKSIMHYPLWAFTKNGQPTITAKNDPKMELGQRVAPTDIDFKKVNIMYNCDKKKLKH